MAKPFIAGLMSPASSGGEDMASCGGSRGGRGMERPAVVGVGAELGGGGLADTGDTLVVTALRPLFAEVLVSSRSPGRRLSARCLPCFSSNEVDAGRAEFSLRRKGGAGICPGLGGREPGRGGSDEGGGGSLDVEVSGCC